jgi:hypothetical protein
VRGKAHVASSESYRFAQFNLAISEKQTLQRICIIMVALIDSLQAKLVHQHERNQIMSDSYELGGQLREFLRGVLDEKRGSGRVGTEWGPRVNLSGLKELHAPQKVEKFTLRPGGIDNLALHSTDQFTIPGKGEYTVDFSGYFRVARDNPTTNDWTSAEVQVNIVDLRLRGKHKEIGEIDVSLNPDILSTGQIFAAKTPNGPKACRIATGAIFELRQMGVSVFNKEPILLMNEGIKSIPPVNDPSGHALLFMVPLFNRADPNGKPIAYLSSLKYGAEDYITEAQANAFRAGRF